MPHKLDALLRPRSIAVVGATQRQHAVGNTLMQNLLGGNYPGELYAVNPRYEQVEGVPCKASLAEIPGKVEHVIFAVSDERIEEAFAEAIEHGARAATIYSSLVLAEDSTPCLRERIKTMAEQAGVLLCGANGMGFYNFTESTWACGFDTRMHRKVGNVSLLSQSGSGMSAILDVDERLNFNFAVSTGQELVVSAEDYLDFVLEQDQTRVIGFFMETSRKPAQLISALEKARRKKIPLVVVKVGRTELSSRLAESHSGALAGSDAVYDAIFNYYGVQRVDDLDELATALIMFAQGHDTAEGGVVAIHDSGGERQLLLDLADKLGTPLCKINADTERKLEGLLDPGLPAVNPLDAWSVGGAGYHEVMAECFVALLNDPSAALGAVVHARAPGGRIYEEYGDYLRKGQQASGKPVFLVAARQGTGEDERVLRWTDEGMPVIDGVSAFLVGARSMIAYRDFLQRPAMALPELNMDKLQDWRAALDSDREFDEHSSAKMLNELGVPMLESKLANNEEELLRAAGRMQYPLVLKSAAPGLKHKTEHKGVRLNIVDEQQLLEHYRDLVASLGHRVLLAQMQSAYGVEMILGIARDEQFGPMIVIGIGGIHAETLGDTILLHPPFDKAYAMQALQDLKLRPLLEGVRGKPAVDLNAYCDAAARLSVIAVELRDQITELDINPMLVMKKACVGLDALICRPT